MSRSGRGALARVAAIAAIAAVSAGCAQDEGGGTRTPPSSASTSATSATTSPPSSGPVEQECAALLTSGRDLLDTVTRFAGGQATGDEVRAAATDLRTAIDRASGVIGAEAGAALNTAKTALGELETALTAQPPDLQSARAAGGEALTGVRDAATLCESGQSTTSR
ncbi:hypothetical protein BAY61_10095 [Prauserella marina]|nr:hypothetical protein BAY61_10095 [Prauserella marina]